MASQSKTCGISDVGLVRQNNEDTWAQIPELGFYILADGMGGHQAGEIASREAVENLSNGLQRAFRGESKSIFESLDCIRETIAEVNTHIFKLGRASSQLKGMGTTLCLLYVHDDGVVYAHIGDSRIYRLRKGKLELLTKDHSLLRELMDLGQISEQQSGEFYYKNIITKALGTEPYVEPSIGETEKVPHDLYVMCSDGLSDLLSMPEIESILNRIKNLSEAADALVALSKMKGGHDNVTLLLVQIVP